LLDKNPRQEQYVTVLNQEVGNAAHLAITPSGFHST
jgi:hypothetical protein